MKITSYLVVMSSFFYFIGCAETENNKSVETEKSDSTLTVATPETAAGGEQISGNSNVNPAHGEPGHRCEIAVGAPLDSEPKESNISTTIQPNLSTTPTLTPTTENVTVAEGTNPPHGQPGHDCAIAVGAPLK